MSMDPSARGLWGSRLAFIMAAAGSAIGLGNVWGFPTQTGLNGGAGFVLVYLIFVLLVGVPVMIAELALGRRSNRDAVGAFKSVVPRSWWKCVGGLGVTVGLVILSYYSVLAGWTLEYIWLTISGAFAGADANEISQIFSDFTSNGFSVLFLHFVFMALTVWVVTGGIQGGIEKVTTLLMPLLLFLLIGLAVRSVTLPGAAAGLEFYLKPDFSRVTGNVVLAAAGQAFFSLSLGMGAMITYGSYLSKKENLASNAFFVCLADLTIAVLAGFVIFPALFSVEGLSPAAGPGLIFVVLPNIFNAIPLGQLFGTCLFVLLAIAALTSSISLLEVVVAYFIDQRGWKRKRAAVAIGASAFLLGVPSALGNGAISFLSHLQLGFLPPAGTGFLSIADFLFGKVLLVVGAFFICLFVGWKWGTGQALEEISRGNPQFGLAGLWSLLVRWVCPISILLILVQQIWPNFFSAVFGL